LPDQSWKSSPEAANPDGVVTEEPGVAELKNGKILMIVRTKTGAQCISLSKDKGETWSPVRRSNISSPFSPASIARIPSTGDLFLVWNDNGKDQKRTPVNIAISKDEGKNWISNKKIEDDPDGWYCYTAIHFAGKYVLFAYCSTSKSAGTAHFQILISSG
jgi:sialidase-1